MAKKKSVKKPSSYADAIKAVDAERAKVRLYPFSEGDQKNIEISLAQENIEWFEKYTTISDWRSSPLTYQILKRDLETMGYPPSDDWTIFDVIEALARAREDAVRAIRKDYSEMDANLIKEWSGRHVFASQADNLNHWHAREIEFLETVKKYDNMTRAKDPAFHPTGPRPWPFAKYGYPYSMPRDIGSVYFAVGAKLDMLFKSTTFLPDDVTQVYPWQCDDHYSRENGRWPYFNGDYMGWDVVERLWVYIEEDLAAQKKSPRDDAFEPDDIDLMIVKIYQKWESAVAEGKKVRRPSYSQIAKAIGSSRELPGVGKITKQAVGARVKKLIPAGIVTDFSKTKEQTLSSEHICDLHADDNTQGVF
jgi:hypothetical protein